MSHNILLNTKKFGDNVQILSEIEEVDASSLISYDRLDIMAKILFLQNQDKPFFQKLYLDSIQYLNGFNEKNEKDKQGKEAFLQKFIETFNSIKEKGFTIQEGVIPIGKDGLILDGAHRVAICYVLGLKVPVVKIDNEGGFKYNASYYKVTGFNTIFIEYLLLEFIKIQKDVLTALFWSGNEKKQKQIEKIYQKYGIISFYQKNITFSEEGQKNIVVACYEKEQWIGNRENAFVGAINKVKMCIDPKTYSKSAVDFLLCTKKLSSQELIDMKEEIRQLFGKGKNSIHITDTFEETLQLSQIFLSKNSLHHINNCHFKYYPDFYNLVDIYTKNMKNNDGFILVGSGALGLYGIRKSQDLDFLSDKKLNFQNENISSHEDYLQLYGLEKSDIIYNPLYHFYFFGKYKVLTLERLKNFKENRGEKKDKNDVELITSFLKNEKTLKDTMMYFKQKMYLSFLNIITKIGKKVIPEKLKPFFLKIYYKIIG
ncbi:hypothetical protein KGV52_00720 [Candidatus Gracilibacteria bacterium]|nr:hypothetical protein [Candidatus Gracilibacteria bacterium]